jgi:hypothetical protein
MVMTVTWLDAGREPREKADPRYPDGIDLDISAGASMRCVTALPYPARGCGSWLVVCDTCELQIVVTAAGRRDDPRSVRMACKQRQIRKH